MTVSLRSIFLAISLPLCCGCTLQNDSATRTMEESISADGIRQIDVDSFNGFIKVESHDQQIIDLRADLKAYGESPEAAESNCAVLEYSMESKDGRLQIKAVRPRSQRSPSMSFTLKVPRDCELNLKTSNGRIDVTSMSAAVVAKTSNGTVSCREIQGSLTIDTSNGTVAIEDVIGPIDVSTSNGRVNYSGKLAGTENSIRTSNGSVTVQLPSEQKTVLSAKTSNGRVKVSLPEVDVQQRTNKLFEGTVGDATSSNEVQLKIGTSNGSVTIESAPPAAADGVNPSNAEALPAEAEAETDSGTKPAAGESAEVDPAG